MSIANFGGATVLGNVPIVNVTTTTTLNIDQGGAIISVASAGASYTITLPAVATAAGVHYIIVLTSTAGSHSTTISAGSGNLNGGALTTSGGAGTCVFHPQVAGTSIAFNTTANVGDRIDIVCDGTSWSYFAFAANATVGFTYV